MVRNLSNNLEVLSEYVLLETQFVSNYLIGTTGHAYHSHIGELNLFYWSEINNKQLFIHSFIRRFFILGVTPRISELVLFNVEVVL